MNVLLTGSAGFVGSHVAEALAAAGHRVRGLDLRPAAPGSKEVGGEGGGEVADVRDAAAVARLLRGVDAVCHQAAKVGLGVDVSDLPAYASANVQGTAVLLAEMARAGVGALVLASSMVVYGEGAYTCERHGSVRPGPRPEEALRAGRFEPACPECGRPLDPGAVGEDAAPAPRNAYADTKLAQEHLAASWARATGGTVAALRYHNVYGPRMPRGTPYAGVAAIFRSRLADGRAPLVFEDGGQLRDFVHVRDVARANVLAVQRVAGARPPEPGGLRAYNVASGEPRTVGDLAAALAAATGGPAPRVTGEYRLGDVRHIVARPDRARRELGFAASVPFADGMAEFARPPATTDADADADADVRAGSPKAATR
ncbi:NAD-dependent epimerase/dehydratase family protein [Actinomadura chibensis]|uniref:NAD-dependent epimerase/dehydratase family protein n=1 Tax=Actinomadura chibensis TaxID=392828 RepID=A0A5D0NA91_9ACTN|nr:NAD-dependent epimerase/dehydratase family protein [Actinomadura chibensis]TYB41353.1 NAD-dependent epimerase/dehydratase family protein [Actinomadura chibensis]